MSRHYGAVELASMNLTTVLASDPIHWKAYAEVVEASR